MAAPNGRENRQIVPTVHVEAKQQPPSETPHVGAILPLVSACTLHTNDSPPKAEPPTLWMSTAACRWNPRVGNGRSKEAHTRTQPGVTRCNDLARRRGHTRQPKARREVQQERAPAYSPLCPENTAYKSLSFWTNSLPCLLSGEGAQLWLVVSFIVMPSRASWGSGPFVHATPHATQRLVWACVLPRTDLAFITKPQPQSHVVAPWPLCSKVVLARLPSKRKGTLKNKCV